MKVGSQTLSVSNLDKVLWPRDGYTKGDLIDYYNAVAPWMVPHLKDRPLTLERYPNGIDASSFFEKQMPKGTPDWVDRVTVHKAGGASRQDRLRRLQRRAEPGLSRKSRGDDPAHLDLTRRDARRTRLRALRSRSGRRVHAQDAGQRRARRAQAARRRWVAVADQNHRRLRRAFDRSARRGIQLRHGQAVRRDRRAPNRGRRSATR